MAIDAKEKPKNRKQLLCRQDKDKWKNTVDEKIDCILNNERNHELQKRKRKEVKRVARYFKRATNGK